MRDFINTRLNKDNFWNVMFFAIFFTGLSLGSVIPQPFGGIVFWLSPVVAVLFVRHNTHLTFDKEKLEFTTSHGVKIQKVGLMFFWLLLSSFFLSAGLAGIINEAINFNLLFFFFTLFPALYCILRNFPISVYFKKEAWIGNGKVSCSSMNSDNNFSSNAFDDSKRTGMNYDYLPNNIWHGSYLDRHRR